MAYKQKSPIPVDNGGTGSLTLTGVCIGNGTSAITGNAVTQYNALIGGASNAISSVAPSATSGIPLISQGSSANPSFGTAVVSGGGTGVTTMTTAYAPVCAGTTATGNLQVASTGLSTAGFILTSTGSSSLPTFQAPAASSISITGNTGGALTGNAFTFTGGTTGLTFAGSGTTETLGGTLVIANGGTNATSFTQSNGIVTYNGTSLVNYAGPQINSSGRMTNTSQPSFLATLTSATANSVTGDGTVYTILFDTAVVNQASGYSTGTGTFTAPVAGNYLFEATVAVTNLSAGHTHYLLEIITTGRSYISNQCNPIACADGNNFANGMKVIANMAASDTAVVKVYVAGSTKTVGVFSNGSGDPRTWFSGTLLC